MGSIPACISLYIFLFVFLVRNYIVSILFCICTDVKVSLQLHYGMKIKHLFCNIHSRDMMSLFLKPRKVIFQSKDQQHLLMLVLEK